MLIRLGHSDDPDDAFMVWALAEQKVDLRGFEFELVPADIQTLNEWALEGRLEVTALAKRLGVSPASASAMVKKLAALDLAVHQPYRGITLTDAGERVALEVIRHHRLLELYLAKTLGLDVDDVHDEAERLEHVISEELEAKIDRALGYPTHDPHGDPIPDAELRWPAAKPR